MKPWFVYILRCKDKSLYTGITTDLKNRVLKHNQGKGAKYTRSRRPVKLVWSEKTKSESSARKKEAQIKNLTRFKKLELISFSYGQKANRISLSPKQPSRLSYPK